MNCYHAAAESKKENVIQLLNKEYSQRQIMIQCNLSQRMLTQKLKEWNLIHKAKPVSCNGKADKVRQLIEENKSKILDLRKSGMGINRLAREFNTSNTIIVRYLALWKIPNAKHGKMLTVHNRYNPQPITDADFEREIKTAVYKKIKHGVSNCFPINSNCERKIID